MLMNVSTHECQEIRIQYYQRSLSWFNVEIRGMKQLLSCCRRRTKGDKLFDPFYFILLGYYYISLVTFYNYVIIVFLINCANTVLSLLNRYNEVSL